MNLMVMYVGEYVVDNPNMFEGDTAAAYHDHDD